MEKIKGRFYLQESLTINATITLTPDVTHHLLNVLRIKDNDFISLFNELDGEFLAQLHIIKKQKLAAIINKKIKDHKNSHNHIHLAYAPLKKDATDFVIEKSTELGVNEITQIITQNTNNSPLNNEKIKSKLVSATNQCGRLDVPTVNEPISLTKFISYAKTTLQDSSIFWLNEKKLGQPLTAFLKNHWQKDAHKTKSIILIGPEGGFSKNEFDILMNQEGIIPVYFNGNILRAETAALLAIAHLQIFCGEI